MQILTITRSITVQGVAKAVGTNGSNFQSTTAQVPNSLAPLFNNQVSGSANWTVVAPGLSAQINNNVQGAAEQNSLADSGGISLNGKLSATSNQNAIGPPYAIGASSAQSTFLVTFKVQNKKDYRIIVNHNGIHLPGVIPPTPTIVLKNLISGQIILQTSNLPSPGPGQWIYNLDIALVIGDYSLQYDALASVAGDPFGESANADFSLDMR